jgi:hypothetical protein
MTLWLQRSRCWNRQIKQFAYAVSAALVILGTSLACNLTELGSDGESKIQDKLLDEYGVITNSVLYADKQVIISYPQPWIQDEGSLFANWLFMMDTAIEEMPFANEVILELNYLGEPHLSVRADAEQIRDVVSGDLDPEAFFNNLIYVELRSADQIIHQDLAYRGIDIESVEISGNEISIEYFQPHFSHQEELLTNWVEMADVALYAKPNTKKIIIHMVIIGQPEVEAEIPADQISAYREGTITPPELISSFHITQVDKVE